MRSMLPGIIGAFMVAALACGEAQTPSPGASLEVPAPREPWLKISPALELSGLTDPSLAGRISIEEISLNIAEVRLLGDDPRIPAGGLPLLSREAVVAANDERSALRLPFPEHLLDEDALAVYLRIGPTPGLGEASVVIRGRLHASPIAGEQPLTREGATDPDGDPARDPESASATDPARSPDREGATDPDGDPARCGATDPDGDPAKCASREHALVERSSLRVSVPFELRDADIAELLAHLDESSRLDVVLGIPASRWFDAAVVARLEAALGDAVRERSAGSQERPERREAIVMHPVKTRTSSPLTRPTPEGTPSDGYYLSDEAQLEGLTVRRER